MDEVSDLSALLALLEAYFAQGRRLCEEDEAAMFPEGSLPDASWVRCVDARFTSPLKEEACAVCGLLFGADEDVYFCGECFYDSARPRRGAHYACWKATPGMVCLACGGVRVE